ncbi:MAG: dual specificity protein phosphatase family protein [Candidatus Eremiobacteraeota bacterium]|nr:dual specificity protein phosphatase family protein [Candidatus Eremiobacteraeota bacterium]MCL5054874.1 dual specificity protein phosphatase family protein [Bacillota bacterium]
MSGILCESNAKLFFEKTQIQKAANAFFKVYSDKNLKKEVLAEISQLTPENELTQRAKLCNLISPLVDTAAGSSASPELRDKAFRLNNLLGMKSAQGHQSTPSPSDIGNFQKVSRYLYRGGQPTKQGFDWLVNHGVKTVVSLRGEDPSDLEVNAWPKVKKVSFSIKDETAPELSQAKKFVEIMNDPEKTPVYVHCKAGVGRTGVMVACYRISHGWSAEKALKEAGKFRFNGALCDEQQAFVKKFEQYWKSKKIEAQSSN